jgi:hypothetical protein
LVCGICRFIKALYIYLLASNFEKQRSVKHADAICGF